MRAHWLAAAAKSCAPTGLARHHLMMDRDRALGLASAVQLSAGIAGVAVALRRRHAYHLPLLHGRPERVARDALIMGTALSPPATMLATQAVATVSLLNGGSKRATRVLGALGALMVTGYLGEQQVRLRLRASGWDGVETPLIIVGISLAAAMAALARTPKDASAGRGRPHRRPEAGSS